MSLGRAVAMARGGCLHVSSQLLQHKLCPLVRVPSTHQHHIHQHRKLNLLSLPLLPSSGTRLRGGAANATIATASALSEVDGDSSAAASSILDKLRSKQTHDQNAKRKPSTLKNKAPSSSKSSSSLTPVGTAEREPLPAISSFRELPLSEELLAAMDELRLTQPTEVQCRAIPAVLDGRSVVVASHTGSGKTLAYMIPIVQCLRKDEFEHGKAPRPRRPRAVVLCPTRELAEQVFRVAKAVSHHARFRVALIGGGVRMKPQEDALNSAIDMLVGTPGRLLKHIEDRNVAYGDIKYVVLDEADTMFDRGFGPDVRKFLSPLRNRSQASEDEGFQAVLVTATITKAVQKLLDDEFPGIKHIRTSSLHKKISTAKHGFIKLAGTENKLESLLQVLEPSLAKGDRVMVFCNTLNSCRAVDHFLNENSIETVNYHGAVPAEERVEVLNKFRNEEGKCPALVCTDLAARGLDLVVNHVIMFDFPLNSIDYLHRTGRTARMGAKGKITSLVTKRSLVLADQIEDAIHKGESLECISSHREETKAPAVKSRRVGKAGSANMGAPLRSSRARGPPSRSAKPAAPRTKGAPARGAVASASKKSPVVRVSKKYPVVRASKAKAPASVKPGPQNVAKKAPKRPMKASGRR